MTAYEPETIINAFGFHESMRLLQEECGELSVAISHHCRDRLGSDEELIEELTDVLIGTDILKRRMEADPATKKQMEKMLKLKQDSLMDRAHKKIDSR